MNPATTVLRSELSSIPTPPHTATHFPLSHSKCVDLIADQIQRLGWEITSEKIETTKGGSRMFGDFGIRSYKQFDYEFTVGFRNSHDKAFSFGLAVGQRVLVCSNESFFGDFVTRRCHTKFASRDLPGVIFEGLNSQVPMMTKIRNWVTDLKSSELVDVQVNDCLIRAMDRGVINASQIPKVLTQWKTPNHSEFKPRTRWSLHNAFTEVMKENPSQIRQNRAYLLNQLFKAPINN